MDISMSGTGLTPPVSIPHEAYSLRGRSPTVVGVYGLPGSGKSFYLEELKAAMRPKVRENCLFYEGAEKIASLDPGGLKTFQGLAEPEKRAWREKAIKEIRQEALDQNKVAIVTGYFMHWPDENADGHMLHTQADLDSFTHIVYLNIPADIVALQRQQDTQGHRHPVSLEHLQRWQQREESELRLLCRLHKIMYLSLSTPNVTTMLRMLQTVYYAQKTEEERVDRILGAYIEETNPNFKATLIIDGDKTLSAEDTGTLFWKIAGRRRNLPITHECPLKNLFGGPLGYSDLAFFQAMLMYQEVDDFEDICEEVASTVSIYPEFLWLLRRTKPGVYAEGTIVFLVTCGLERVWDFIMQKAGLSYVVVVGSGPAWDKTDLVAPSFKAAVVKYLRDLYNPKIWVFGDDPLDLPMLLLADRAVVVVGEEQTRSSTLDGALLDAIENKDLKARQVLVPDGAKPRLTTEKLPVMRLTDPELLGDMLYDPAKMVHLPSEATANLLITPTHSASIAGSTLRGAHRRIGWYLATAHVGELIGLEEYTIPHVRGVEARGYRLLNEQQTCIIALTPGGESIATGVNDAFPLASLVHAESPHLDLEGLKAFNNIIVVDSPVNSGKSIKAFLEKMGPSLPSRRIVVVAGNVLQESVKLGSVLAEMLTERDIELVALQLS